MTSRREFLGSARGKGLLLDANVLLLVILGGIEPGWIGQFERTWGYTIADYEALNEAVRSFVRFSRVSFASTPNILTEVSNLANKLHGERRARFYEQFAGVIATLDVEEYVRSDAVCHAERFAEFGLTDLGIAHVAKDRYLVLSGDGRLVSHLRSLEIAAMSLAEIRALA